MHLISMVIAETASGNVASLVAKIDESVLAGQNVILTRGVATPGRRFWRIWDVMRIVYF